MSTISTNHHGSAAHAAAHDDHHHDTGGNTILGFWVYLMSDVLIFASLFATYVVLAVPTVARRPRTCLTCPSSPGKPRCCCSPR
jgi:heme/copper-type cytochrome/quinol oxidase subunit 3